jgi:protein pelota
VNDFFCSMKLVTSNKKSSDGFATVGAPGSVKLIPEDSEDMWQLYNLIRVGDHVTANTYRKVTRDKGTSTETEKIRITLTLVVEEIDYDGAGQEIRLKGKNLTENEHVKLGAYHTLEIEPNRSLTLTKENWDALDIDRVKQSTDPSASADVAVVMVTEGFALVCLVGSSCTVVKSKIETSIPKKKGAAIAGYDKAITTFYSRVYAAVVKHVDWNVIKCLVLAGPGFAKDSLRDYIDLEAQRQQNKELLHNRSKILVAPASSPYKHAIKEVLASPDVASKIKDTKAAQEIQKLGEFMTMLGSDPSRAFYGPGHVNAAHELGAIQSLLLSDSLFRTADPILRTKYTNLVEDVRHGGGDAYIFSGAHTSGEQLNQLSGIAAILRFPLPELEDMEFNEGY